MKAAFVQNLGKDFLRFGYMILVHLEARKRLEQGQIWDRRNFLPQYNGDGLLLTPMNTFTQVIHPSIRGHRATTKANKASYPIVAAIHAMSGEAGRSVKEYSTDKFPF